MIGDQDAVVASRMFEDYSPRIELLNALPIKRSGIVVRLFGRADLDLLAAWPSYTWPYDVFRFSFASCDKCENDAFFEQRIRLDDRISLVADAETHLAIGYLSLIDIDWHEKQAGNMGIRVHPDWCDKGTGTTMLELVRDWWLDRGMNGLCLDVAATNRRAIACYKKVGFRKADAFWMDASDLKEEDLDDPRNAFLRGHVRSLGATTQLRFYWMVLGRI